MPNLQDFRFSFLINFLSIHIYVSPLSFPQL